MPAAGPPKRNVISASRRTDIPAFYMNWFMDGVSRGFFEVENPYSGKGFRVSANPEETHSVVFWSKNPGPFLDGNFGQRLMDRGFHLFFNVTINSEHTILEPNVPTLDERLGQIPKLCRIITSRAISWRFDPICFLEDKSGRITDNRSDFLKIAKRASDAGIRRCITSFVDLYPKVLARKHPDIRWVDIGSERKTECLLTMEDQLKPLGIELYLCCEKDIFKRLPETSSIRRSSCISADILRELFGPGISMAKDQGQRKNHGCGCSISKDIGSYRLQPCFHNCLFCYANPANPGGLLHA